MGQAAVIEIDEHETAFADPSSTDTELWRRYQADKTNLTLRDRLVERYKGLVPITFRRLALRVPWDDKPDFLQEGCIGLILAVEEFDQSRQVKFETYAISRIRGKMYECQRQYAGGSRNIPRSVQEATSALAKAEALFISCYQNPPRSDEELANFLDYDEEKLTSIRELLSSRRQETSSLEEPLLTSDGVEPLRLWDILRDEARHDPETAQLRNYDRRPLRAALNALPPREKTAITLRFFEGKSQERIGKEDLHVHESRVWQLQQLGMLRLRFYLRGCDLSQLLDDPTPYKPAFRTPELKPFIRAVKAKEKEVNERMKDSGRLPTLGLWPILLGAVICPELSPTEARRVKFSAAADITGISRNQMAGQVRSTLVSEGVITPAKNDKRAIFRLGQTKFVARLRRGIQRVVISKTIVLDDGQQYDLLMLADQLANLPALEQVKPIVARLEKIGKSGVSRELNLQTVPTNSQGLHDRIDLYEELLRNNIDQQSTLRDKLLKLETVKPIIEQRLVVLKEALEICNQPMLEL